MEKAVVKAVKTITNKKDLPTYKTNKNLRKKTVLRLSKIKYEEKIVQIKIWRKFSSSSVAIALSGNEQTTTNIIIIRMSKFKLILILFVAPFLIEAQEGNVAEIFMDTSYNLDFGSSLYNDLSYFFANVSPDGNYCQHCENPQHIFSQ